MQWKTRVLHVLASIDPHLPPDLRGAARQQFVRAFNANSQAIMDIVQMEIRVCLASGASHLECVLDVLKRFEQKHAPIVERLRASLAAVPESQLKQIFADVAALA